MKPIAYSWVLTCILMMNCQNHRRVLPSMDQADFSEADIKYRDMFKPLDGNWSGLFRIYQDPNGQEKQLEGNMPVLLDTNDIVKFDLISTISVRQAYRSQSPYYQRVEITDTYIHNGDTSIVQSVGVNKIENGRIWCIVQKPDEEIIHEGIWPMPNTIIWSRWEKDPLKKEYFRETVHDDQYSIVGYGYYGSDDPKLAPKTWFLGNYTQISDYFR